MKCGKLLHQTTYAMLRLQLQSHYFSSTDIQFLNTLPIESGVLVFFYTNSTIFSLGVSLLDKHSHLLLGTKTDPIWRSTEDIQALHMTQVKQHIEFYFAIEGKQHTLCFPIDDLLYSIQFGTVFKKPIQNPILKPNVHSDWESISVFNPAALHMEDNVHFVYRAVGQEGRSVLGYAMSRDGIHIDERLSMPIFPLSDYLVQYDSPNTSIYTSGPNCYGCEDPRLIHIEDTIYMTYTAFDGHHAPGVNVTKISVKDFLNRIWNWSTPVRLSPPNEVHKNWVIFPELIQGSYAILHSLTPSIQIDYFDNLDFTEPPPIKSYYAPGASATPSWDSWVRGVGPVPIRVDDGWLVLYHAMDHLDPDRYKLGAMILDTDNPKKMLYRANMPLLEPNEPYENEGFKSGVLYSCGAIIKNQQLMVYYGGADTVVCVAFANITDVIQQIKKQSVV